MAKLLKGCGLLVFALLACSILMAVVDLGGEPDVSEGTSGTTAPRATSAPRPTSGPALELLESSPTSKDYSRYIVGRVRNNSSRTYSYVQISFNLYDASGAQVGTAWTNITNLEAGGIWAFEALLFEDNVKTYKLAELTGW